MKVIPLPLLPAKEKRDEFHILKGDVYFYDVAHTLNSHQQMKVIAFSLLLAKEERDEFHKMNSIAVQEQVIVLF